MANLSNINNKFIVEDSGDVGIGVTTATTKLHIGGTAPGDSIIRQDSTVSGTNWEIGERAAGKWQIFEDDGDTIVATFTSTGEVGIGATTVTQKGFWFDTTNNYLSINKWSSTATPAAMLHLFGGDNDIDVPAIIIEGRDNPNDTRLKIAVKDPQVRFLLDEGSDAVNGYGLMTFETTAQPNPAASERGGFDFDLPGGTAMTILNTGHVGIGTSSPGNLLDVAGDTDISGQLFVQHSGSYTAKLKQLATSMSNATYTFEIDSTAHTSNLSTAGAMSVDVDSGRAFTINGLGNAGIGTDSPGERLEVKGNIVINSQSTSSATTELDQLIFRKLHPNGASSGFYNQASVRSKTFGGYSGGLNFYTNKSLGAGSYGERLAMSIDNFQNVGIGTDSPNNPLTVAGNLLVTTTVGDGQEDRFKVVGGGSGDDGNVYVYNDTQSATIRLNSGGASYFTNGLMVGYTSGSYKVQVLEESTNTTNIGVYTNIRGAGTNNYAFYADAANGTSTNFGFYGNSGKNAFLGDTGIGTDSPTARLNVVGVGQANNPTVAIDVTNSDSFNHGLEIFDGNLTTGETVLTAIGHSGATKLAAIFGFVRNENSLDQNLATIGFWGANNLVTVSPAGNVGIGTGTTPASTRLQVVGTGTQASFETTASYSDILFKNSATSNFLNFSGSTFIVYQGGGSGSNVTFAVDSGGTATFKADVVAYGSPSDKRLKENIKPIESALDKVSKLQGVTFDWKEKAKNLDKEGNPINLQQWKHDVGFIAQDVQKVIPELVRENEDGMLSMRHQGVAPILLEAIKEQQEQIKDLRNQINLLKSK